MADMPDIPRSTPTNKSFYPILEPFVDAAAFIGSGILATSYLTTWINDPISNSGVIVSGIFSAASVQLAKKILPPNDSILRKMVSTIMGLGLPTISLPYLPISLGVAITQKAAFQIGAIHLGAKAGIYVLQFLGSKVGGKVETRRIDPNFTLSEDPKTIQNYNKEEATIAHEKLLAGNLWFQNSENKPNLAVYTAYFTLFQKYELPITTPKSLAEISAKGFPNEVFYYAYYKCNPQKWSQLTLPMQFSFSQISSHGEMSHDPLFLFPANQQEIAEAPEEIITCIHQLATNNFLYWKEMKFQKDLSAAFKKFALAEIGSTFTFSTDPNVIAKYTINEASIAHMQLLKGKQKFLHEEKSDLATYNAYFTLFKKYELTIPTPKSVAKIDNHTGEISMLYHAYYKYDPTNWSKLPLQMQHSFRSNFLYFDEVPDAPYLYPSSSKEIEEAPKEVILAIYHLLAQEDANYLEKIQFKLDLNAAFKKFKFSTIQFPLSTNLAVIANYSKEDASIAHMQLLEGKNKFLHENKPALETYNAYFILFQKHHLLIPTPKSVDEIENHEIEITLLYHAYYKYDPKNWPKLPLVMQKSFSDSFFYFNEVIPEEPYFLYPSNTEEIENGSRRALREIYNLAKNNPKYWQELQFKQELRAAFAKIGCADLGFAI